jgi:hypothetical protein
MGQQRGDGCVLSGLFFFALNIPLVWLNCATSATGWPPADIEFQTDGLSKIAVISASIGERGGLARANVAQTFPADFILFTDNAQIANPGNWTIDVTPYHIVIPSALDNGSYVNSLARNNHPYMLYKYYKMQFHHFPRLFEYDMIVWIDIDKTIEDADCLEYLAAIFRNFTSKNIIAQSQWPIRRCLVALEVEAAADDDRWSGTTLKGKRQPFQDVRAQYTSYLADGYREDYWQKENATYRATGCLGLWQTNFMAFRMRSPVVQRFLDGWYLETLKWTTMCQVSAPYVLQKLGEIPYTLPDAQRPFFPNILTHSIGWRFLRRDD